MLPAFPSGAAPLAVQVRSDRVESVHVGHLAVVDRDGRLVFGLGNPHEACYARSSLKPVQILPLLLSGAAEAYGLGDEAIAVGVASHSGQPVHVAAVEAMLARAGLGPELLQCGSHAPYHAPSAEALACAGLAPSALHCNCSGKHAAMLATCRHMGWDLASYRAIDHPLQQAIRTHLAMLAGVPPCAIGWGVDGCGVPVWHLPLTALARAFARLGDPASLPEDYAEAARRIAIAMARHPLLVAGEGRLDTDLLAAAGGALIGKIGGEGVHAGAVVGAGLGWAIKVADGNRRAIAPALARALAALGRPLPEDAALATHIRPELRNNLGQVVGALLPAW